MDQAEILEVGREAIFVLIKISAPIMIVSLVVGLIVALFQALTQIQEMTLTFVPKVLAIFVTIILTMPFMLNTLSDFTVEMADRIVSIE